MPHQRAQMILRMLHRARRDATRRLATTDITLMQALMTGASRLTSVNPPLALTDQNHTTRLGRLRHLSIKALLIGHQAEANPLPRRQGTHDVVPLQILAVVRHQQRQL